MGTGEARARGERVPVVLEDPSMIWNILSDLKHYGVAPDLWHRSRESREEYSCLIHFFSPITRLPFELLHQILLIIIDEMSGPPSVLMLVCKTLVHHSHQYLGVTQPGHEDANTYCHKEVDAESMASG